MPKITLKSPVIVDGVEVVEFDFDPSIDALEAFEAAVRDGVPQTTALKALIAFDGDVPKEAAGKVRMSSLVTIGQTLSGPFGAGLSATAAGGE